jgi:hypothetical protein
MDRQLERNMGGQENLGKRRWQARLKENIKIKAGYGMEDAGDYREVKII